MKDPAHITALYKKYINNLCNPQELQELLSHFQLSEIDPEIASIIQSELGITDSRYQSLEQVKSIVKRLDQTLPRKLNDVPVKKMAILRLLRYWPAAAVLVLVPMALYFTNNSLQQFNRYTSEYKNDVSPGANKAYLTLASGKKIVLDSAF
ncbi:MAG: hypothetical protein ACQUHE_17680, partial [Bacteroidia bacterium]